MDAKATGALTAAAAVLLVLTACVAGLPPQNPPCIKHFPRQKAPESVFPVLFLYNTASDFVNIHHLTVFDLHIALQAAQQRGGGVDRGQACLLYTSGPNFRMIFILNPLDSTALFGYNI